MPARSDAQFESEANGAEQKPAPKRLRRLAEGKRRIAEASLKPGASVQQVAQAYGVHRSQVRKWRRLYRRGMLGDSKPALLAVHSAESMPEGARSRMRSRSAAKPKSLTLSLHGHE